MHKTVCRVETVTRSEIGRFTYHNIRTPDHAERYAGQEHIRTEDMHKNAVLFGTDHPTRDVKQKIKGVKMARSAKGGEGQDIVAQEIILSAHSDFFKNMPEKHIKIWEQANLKFLKERFPGNLVSVVVHRDERAPHIHAIVVPIVDSKRVKGEKVLNATEYLGNRGSELRALKKQGRAHESTLGKLQTEYTNAMQKAGFKLERGAENSEEKHVKVELFRKLEKELNAAKQEIQQLNNSKNALTAQVQQLNNTKKEANNSLDSVVKTLKDGTNAIDALKKNYARLHGEFKEAESKWHGEIAKLEGLAAQGKEAVQSVKAEAEKAQAEAEQARAEAEQARAEAEAAKADFENFSKSDAVKEIIELRAEAKLFRDYRNDMLTQVTDMQEKQNGLAPGAGVNLFKHIQGVLDYAKVQNSKTYAQYYLASIPRSEAVAIIHHSAQTPQNWEKDAMYKQYQNACDAVHQARLEQERQRQERERQAEREARRSRSHSHGMSR